MNTVNIIKNLSVLHENAERGPHLRKIKVDLVQCAHFSLFKFSVNQNQGYGGRNPLDSDQFLGEANGVINEVFAVAELTGTPFRDMLLNATYKSDLGTLGFAVSGRAAARIAETVAGRAEAISLSVQSISDCERRQLHKIQKDTVPVSEFSSAPM